MNRASQLTLVVVGSGPPVDYSRRAVHCRRRTVASCRAKNTWNFKFVSHPRPLSLTGAAKSLRMTDISATDCRVVSGWQHNASAACATPSLIGHCSMQYSAFYISFDMRQRDRKQTYEQWKSFSIGLYRWPACDVGSPPNYTNTQAVKIRTN